MNKNSLKENISEEIRKMLKGYKYWDDKDMPDFNKGLEKVCEFESAVNAIEGFLGGQGLCMVGFSYLGAGPKKECMVDLFRVPDKCTYYQSKIDEEDIKLYGEPEKLCGNCRFCFLESGTKRVEVDSKSQLREEVLTKALAAMASNFGRGSFSSSPDFETQQKFRGAASKALKDAGYEYKEYPSVPPEGDGWYLRGDK